MSDPLGDNQVCTLFGSEPGSTTVAGADYLQAGYSLDIADQWRRNFVVLLGFFITFQVTQLLLIEFFPVSSVSDDRKCVSTSSPCPGQQYHGNAGVIVYAKPSRKNIELNAQLAERKATREKSNVDELDGSENSEQGPQAAKQEAKYAASRLTCLSDTMANNLHHLIVNLSLTVVHSLGRR